MRSESYSLALQQIGEGVRTQGRETPRSSKSGSSSVAGLLKGSDLSTSTKAKYNYYFVDATRRNRWKHFGRFILLSFIRSSLCMEFVQMEGDWWRSGRQRLQQVVCVIPCSNGRWDELIWQCNQLFSFIGSISPADGSSFVKMGQTSVCGGAVAEIGKPTDTSKNGQIGTYQSMLISCNTVRLSCLWGELY